jgi:hypothetical protein
MQNVKIQNYGTGYKTMSSDWGPEVTVKTYRLHFQMACEDTQQAPQNHS